MQKVALTDEQITEICEALPVNRALPALIAKSIIFQIRSRLAVQLAPVRLYPPLFPRFKEEIIHSYYKTLSESGTAVGIQASTSLGERQTQTTLNTFHAAGISVKTVVVGVPRFSELLNATKSPKMVNCLIFLNDAFDSIGSLRDRIGSLFTHVPFRRIIKSYTVIKEEEWEDWHHLFCEVFDLSEAAFHPDHWRIRFELNTDVMFEYKISMRMVRDAIQNAYQDCFVLSKPDSEGIIDVFLDRSVFLDVDAKRGVIMGAGAMDEEETEEVEEVEVGAEEDNEADEIVFDDEDVPSHPEEDEVVPLEVEEPSRPASESVEMMPNTEESIPADIHRVIHVEDKIVPHLMNVRIAGVERIKDIFPENRNKEWLIATEGSNLYGLFALPLVDKTRTMCNNMWEIYHVFGIEAARQFLIEEYMEVMSSDGSFINKSHVELLVDVMVYTGSIIAISRYGLKKVSCGPLAKASFEESVDNFLKAGLNGEKESANSVSASIMLGKPPKTGTGVFDLMMDLSQLATMPTSMEVDIKQPDPVEEKKSVERVESIPQRMPEPCVPKERKPPRTVMKDDHVVEKPIEVNQPAMVVEPSAPKRVSQFYKKKMASTSGSGMNSTTASEFTKKNSFFDD